MQRECREGQRSIFAEVHAPTQTPWSSIGERILEIQKNNVGEYERNWEEQHEPNPDFTEDKPQKLFQDPSSTCVLLKDGVRIIGYSLAIPDEDYNDVKTAYIYDTEIEKKYQGRGLIAEVMNKMEEELKKLGYKQITRDVMVEGGYAANIKNTMAIGYLKHVQVRVNKPKFTVNNNF